MPTAKAQLCLVGDNPFHGVSHLSQERSIERGDGLGDPAFAARLVELALANGADGFMFTVSETTLAILRKIGHNSTDSIPGLYAIVPYVPEFVRIAATAGGIPGLATSLGRQIVLSGNWRTITAGMRGVLSGNPGSLLQSYLFFEIARIRHAAGKGGTLSSLMLHEVVTDMALALEMRWLFQAHLHCLRTRGIRPGFETRNFVHLVRKLEAWGVDLDDVVVAAPFNSIGFQMCPSRSECEAALQDHPELEVIGFSILAAGYVTPAEASEYMVQTNELDGVAVGVSKAHHARETFRLLKNGCKEQARG